MAEEIGKVNGSGAGSNLLALSSVELTDASAVFSTVVRTGGVNDIIIDVITDKGGTLIVTPILDIDDDTALGQPFATTTVPNGGPSDRGSFAAVSAPKAKVVFTKTEAGTTSGFMIAVRGTVN